MATMATRRRDTQHYTYADYLTWPDDQRYELIDGIAYLMAAPSRAHQEIVGELYRQVANSLEGKPCRAYVSPFDVRLPKAGEKDDEVDTVVQPDVLVFCDHRKLDERGARGAPDWVAEVLSPSTASHDQSRKLATYERVGVPEIWLIHPTDRTLSIYRLEAAQYGRAIINELKGQTAMDAVPGVTIYWDPLLVRLNPPSTA
jgi:Uma2 family endonuclease